MATHAGLLVAFVEGVGAFDPVLSIAASCPSGTSLCTNDHTSSGELAWAEVEAGDTRYVIVDSVGLSGAFRLDVATGPTSSESEPNNAVDGPSSANAYAYGYVGDLSAGDDDVVRYQPSQSGSFVAKLIPLDGVDDCEGMSLGVYASFTGLGLQGLKAPQPVPSLCDETRVDGVSPADTFWMQIEATGASARRYGLAIFEF